MDTNLKLLVGEVLNVDEDSERLRKVLDILEENGIRNEDDLKYLTRDDFRGELTKEEFKLMSIPILRMSLDEGLCDILKHPRPNVIECFKENGCSKVSDLKYFDWFSLEELKCLSEMEIKKIMRFVEEYFPEEYNGHKAKKTRCDRLKRELDLLDSQKTLDRETQHFRRDTFETTFENTRQALENTTERFNKASRPQETSGMTFGVLQPLAQMLFICSTFASLRKRSGENITYRDIELD